MALFDPGTDGAPLALLALGVVGDDRALPELQPRLPEGIHLRWAADPSHGFPWWGFYLFRRLTLTTGVATCASSQFGGLTPGPLPTPDLTIPLGTFHSDQNLVLTDDFPSAGTVEIDLSGRTFVTFEMDPALPNRRVDVTLGFVADFPPPGGGTPGPGGPGTGTAGGLGSGAAQASLCGCGCAHDAIQPIVESVVAIGPGQFRATFGYDNAGAAPTSMPIGPENRFFPDPADRGQPTLLAAGRQTDAFSVVFDGRPLTWRLAGNAVTVSSADAQGGGGGGGGGGGDGPGAAGIVVVALRAGVVVATRVVPGHAGQVVTIPLHFESIDEIRVASGPARLIDVCATRNTDGGGQGWAPVPGLTQPITLPVRAPNYPVRQGSPNLSESEALALARITYAFPAAGSPPGTLDTNEWAGQNFSDLHDMLLAILTRTPPALTDHLQDVPADPDPDDPNALQPTWTQQSTLGIILSASVNPAVAQMLGLYFIDSSAVEGQSYDYTLVADTFNAGNGNVNTILGLVTAQNFSKMDAYRRIGVVRAASPSLTPPDPATLQGYALPLPSVPASAPADAAGLIGLRWGVSDASDQSSKIAPTESILFHVWRKDFGPAGPGQGETFDPTGFVKQTASPIAVGRPRVEDPPAKPIAGWPSTSLFDLEGPLVEGWYSYRVNGIDIFGRYSDRSELVPWLNQDGSLHDARAIQVIDTTPPPPPVHVQAWLLDPQDPFVLQDAAYSTWRSANPGTVGLRVRWAWGAQERRQAPDAREFRIYLQPGSQLDDASVPLSWAQRCVVVGLGEQMVAQSLLPLQTPPPNPQNIVGAAVSISGARITLLDGPPLDSVRGGEAELELVVNSVGTQFAVVDVDPQNRVVTIDQPIQQVGAVTAWALLPLRTYELFLPGTTLATPPAFTPPPPPPRATPVAYDLVGVSAADNKDRADLRPTPQPLTPRLGNEGNVGGPAVVIQLLRTPPDPPPAPFDQESLLATRADFQSRSFFTLHAVKQPGGQPAMAVHVYRTLDETLFQVDAQKGFAQGARTGEANSISLSALGPSWTAARRSTAANELGAMTSVSSYGQLSNDALRLLASFPSNVAAYSCITRAPLPADSTDDRGLSDPPSYDPNARADIAAFTDILDGRTTNRYFYRTTLVDSAQNQSVLGVATPPVYLPLVVIPSAPVLVDAGAGDRVVRLEWQSSNDPNVTEYRIYRASSEAEVQHLLVTDRVFTVPEPAAPGQRPATVVKDNLATTAGTPLFYGVTAAAVPPAPASPRESAPSRIVALTAFDATRPAPPTWNPPQPQAGGAVLLSWTTQNATLVKFLVQRRQPPSATWVNLSTWLPGDARQFLDQQRASGVQYEYRLVAMDDQGRQNKDFLTVTA